MIKQIIGEAKVDVTSYRHFAEFQLFKSRNPRLRKKAFYGLNIVSSLLMFLIGLSFHNINYFFFGAAIMLFLILFTYMTKQIFKKQCQLNHKLLKSTQKYVFAPDGFIFEMTNGEENSRDEMFYSDINVIYDVKEAYYLYKDKKHAFIVPKNSIKKATSAQTRVFLQSKVPSHKYIVVK